MKLSEIINIHELYILRNDSFNSHKYEIQLIEGLKKDIYWLSLSDKEKLELRIAGLMKKYAFKELYSDIIILYEERVIELTKHLMQFLDTINLIVFDSQKMSEEEFLLFRLKNMLYLELYSLNKREKLQYSGHVLFEEVVEPLFIELENTSYYIQYHLSEIKMSYKHVSDLFKKEPYKQ